MQRGISRAHVINKVVLVLLFQNATDSLLLNQHPWRWVSQICWTNTSGLFWCSANPLDDHLFQVSVLQLVFHWKLMHSQLGSFDSRGSSWMVLCTSSQTHVTAACSKSLMHASYSSSGVILVSVMDAAGVVGQLEYQRAVAGFRAPVCHQVTPPRFGFVLLYRQHAK